MKKLLAWLSFVTFLVVMLSACGADSGGSRDGFEPDDGDTDPPVVTPIGPPANIVLTNDLLPGAYLTPNDETTFTAYVTDANDQPVDDGTSIYFAVSDTNATIDASATTLDGFAVVNFQTGTATGTVTVTASTKTDPQTGTSIIGSKTVDIVSTNEPLTNIVLTNGLLPGASLAAGGETVFTAYVTNASGQPVTDGTVIYFSTADSEGNIESSATTSDGVATATFQAGTSTGTVSVTASSAVDIQTGNSVTATASVSIVNSTDRPANIILTSGLTPGSSLQTGGETTITAFVTDTKGLKVLDGTVIYFSVSGSSATIEASATTIDGFAIATLQAGTVSGSVVINAATATDIITGTNVTATMSMNIVSPVKPPAKIVLTNGLLPGASLSQGDETDITAYVTDIDGQPVLDGTMVQFSVNNTGAIIDASAITTGGIAVVTFNAGTATEVVTVTAATAIDIKTGTRATQSLNISIATVGPPANIVLTNGLLAGDYLLPGDETDITAYVTDEAGQPVLNGTVIFFTASDPSVTIDATATTNNGIATANFSTEAASGNITVSAATAIDIKTGTNVSNTVVVPIVSPPAAIVLTNGLPPDTSLSPEGTTTVTAVVTDSAGRPVVDGTVIFFTTSGLGSTVEASSTTIDGIVTASFTAGATTGTITVTAASEIDIETGNRVTGSVNIPVVSKDAASIKFISVSPESFIGIKGSGQNEFAEILFRVLGADGNPVPDGTEIDFALTLSLHGGERLLEDSALTVDGEVVAKVQSGYVAGPLRVVASYTNEDGLTISTQGLVAVVSGPADLEHFTISQELFNQAGYRYEGLLNRFHAVLADRFGNIVKDGTPVSFISDCGRIGVNAEGVDELGSFEITTSDGKATAEFRTSNPLKPLCSIVAYTPGQESFDDLNGNGVYDEGVDICTADIGEPYIDEDLNGSYTAGELYIDTDANSQYTAANGQCDMDTLIWGSTYLTMSSDIGPMELEVYDSNTGIWEPLASSLGIARGESRALRFKVQDLFGSRLVKDTEVTISGNEAPLQAIFANGNGCANLDFTGTDYQIFGDRLGPGDLITFVLQDSSPEGSGALSCPFYLDIWPPEEPDDDDGTVDAGTNGTKVTTTFVVNYGNASSSGDVTPPTVLLTIPANGASQVLADSPITVVFSEGMNALTVMPESITLSDLTEGTQRPTYVDADDSTSSSYTFIPDGGFTAGHDYRVTVANTVEDLAGNNMVSDYSFDFTSIGALVDPPRVVFTSPGQAATNVRRSASIVVEFSQPMDPGTVSPVTVFLDKVGGASVPIVLTEVNPASPIPTTFIFDPDGVELDANSTYRITVTANVRDASDIPMDKDFTTTFTTGSLD